MKLFSHRFGPMLANDFARLMIGKKIGSGTYRDVFEFPLNADFVIKAECRGEAFCNASEYSIWNNSEGHAWRKWLAPVEWISPFGGWLIMRRTKPITARDLPKRVPNCFADLKPQNWGLLDGRPVCHDYGNHSIFEVARKAHEMIPARWHNGVDGKTLKP